MNYANQFDSIVFFTGAGISAESSVPTYRGKGGIWEKYDWQTLACQRAFDQNPERVLEFHEFRRSLVFDCKPNPAHNTISQLEQTKAVFVVTQNIDGLHQKAGSGNVVELHGSLWRLRCDYCGRQIEDLNRKYRSKKCACGQWLRPAITWFEDSLESGVFAQAHSLIESCDLFISIGTSGSVWPAAGLPQIAFDGKAHCIELNLEKTEYSPMYNETYFGLAGTILPSLFQFK